MAYHIRHCCIGTRREAGGATMAINMRIVTICGAHTTPSHVPRLTNESIKQCK